MTNLVLGWILQKDQPCECARLHASHAPRKCQEWATVVMEFGYGGIVAQLCDGCVPPDYDDAIREVLLEALSLDESPTTEP